MGRTGHLIQERLQEVPVPLRQRFVGFAVGFVVFGSVGGAVGLVIGLETHVPTAWIALFEIGIPASFLGCVVGLIVGGLVAFHDRLRGD